MNFTNTGKYVRSVMLGAPNDTLPTGALDTKTSAEIMDVFKTLNSDGKTIVIVTHDPKVAEQCGRIIEISDGRIV